jgi:sec-independent protein translocase protein TatB
MDILGIGPTELAFIVLIALILLGPKEMQKAGRTIGRWLRDFVSSDSWKAFRETSREIRNLPNRLMREANLEDMKNLGDEIKQSVDLRKERFGIWGDPTKPDPKPLQPKPVPAETSENQIAPPTPTPEKKEPDSNA